MIGNKLTNLRCILGEKEFVHLKASKNQIQYLSNDDFKTVKSIQNIELQENEIREIDTNTFITLRKNLKKLDLSSNSISSLNGCVRYLSHLRWLNLTNNKIEVKFFSLNFLFQDTFLVRLCFLCLYK